MTDAPAPAALPDPMHRACPACLPVVHLRTVMFQLRVALMGESGRVDKRAVTVDLAAELMLLAASDDGHADATAETLAQAQADVNARLLALAAVQRRRPI